MILPLNAFTLATSLARCWTRSYTQKARGRGRTELANSQLAKLISSQLGTPGSIVLKRVVSQLTYEPFLSSRENQLPLQVSLKSPLYQKFLATIISFPISSFCFLLKVLNLFPIAIHVSKTRKILCKLLKHSHKSLAAEKTGRETKTFPGLQPHL